MMRKKRVVSFSVLLAMSIFFLGLFLVAATEYVSRSSLDKTFKHNSKLIRQDYIDVKKGEVRNEVLRLIQMIHAVDMETRYQMRGIVEDEMFRLKEKSSYLSKLLSLSFPEDVIRNFIISLIEGNSFHMGDGAFALITADGDVLNGDTFSFSRDSREVFLSRIRSSGEFYMDGRMKNGKRFIGYVSFFNNLGLYVMAYIMPENFIRRVQRKFLISVVKTNGFVNPNDYFFINKTDGEVIIFQGQLFENHIKLWQFNHGEESYLKALFYKELKSYKMGGGFIKYRWLSPKTGRICEKIAYIAGYRPWGWIVGKGFYLSDVEEALGRVNGKLKAVIEDVQNWVFLLALVLFLAIFAISIAVFRLTQARMKGMMEKIEEALSSGRKIDVDGYWIKEMRTIAGYINTVLDRFERYENEFLEAFIMAMEMRDLYTKGHSQRVGLYASIIASELGMDEKKGNELYRAGLLHDIGKLGIPDNILLKPGRLTKNEYNIIKYHPIFSYEIVSRVSRFKGMAEYIKHHHERCDGSGYPDGLECDAIELEARILAVADVFDALTTSRPYRKAFTPREAIEIMKKEKLDQRIVRRVADRLVESYVRWGSTSSTEAVEDVEQIRKELFDIDYKTGLKRRRVVLKHAGELIAQKRPFVLFMVDIKNLNFINFEFSHDVGDRVISCSAMALSDLLVEMGYKENSLSRAYDDAFLFIVEGSFTDSEVDGLSQDLKSRLIKSTRELLRRELGDLKGKSGLSIEGFVDFHVIYARYPDEAADPEELLYICIHKKNFKKDLYIDYNGEN